LPRSIKKGPYIDEKLLKKIRKVAESGKIWLGINLVSLHHQRYSTDMVVRRQRKQQR